MLTATERSMLVSRLDRALLEHGVAEIRQSPLQATRDAVTNALVSRAMTGRIDFSRAVAALIASSGSGASISSCAALPSYAFQ